jgi:hypothetical protein
MHRINKKIFKSYSENPPGWNIEDLPKYILDNQMASVSALAVKNLIT